MILDGLLLFSSSQNVTTGSTVSTNVIDLLNARDIGVGDNPAMKIAMYVMTGFATTDAGVLTVEAQGSTDNSTFSVLAQSRAYSAAELITGAKLFPIDWPALSAALPLHRYLRLNYNAGALHFTPGAVTAMLVLDRQDDRAYPAGINISN